MDPGSAEATAGGGTATAAASEGGAKVAIDGQDQNVSGTVVCSAIGGSMNIAIGDAATGIATVVSEDGSNVTSVGLGNVNGVTLGYQSGTGQGEAKATKDGNTWKITGTATGIDLANPMQTGQQPVRDRGHLPVARCSQPVCRTREIVRQTTNRGDCNECANFGASCRCPAHGSLVVDKGQIKKGSTTP